MEPSALPNGWPLSMAVTLFAPPQQQAVARQVQDLIQHGQPWSSLAAPMRLLWIALCERGRSGAVAMRGRLIGSVEFVDIPLDFWDEWGQACPNYEESTLTNQGTVYVNVRVFKKERSAAPVPPAAPILTPSPEPEVIAKQKKGPRPEKREATRAKMLENLKSGKTTVERLNSDTQENLAQYYGVSREICVKARAAALLEFAGVANSLSHPLILTPRWRF